jgi:hypothetical protein
MGHVQKDWPIFCVDHVSIQANIFVQCSTVISSLKSEPSQSVKGKVLLLKTRTNLDIQVVRHFALR